MGNVSREVVYIVVKNINFRIRFGFKFWLDLELCDFGLIIYCWSFFYLLNGSRIFFYVVEN